MVVRKTNTHIIVQMVTAGMEGDFTLVSANSKDLVAVWVHRVALKHAGSIPHWGTVCGAGTEPGPVCRRP